MTIGILALQGSVIEHRRLLEKLGVTVREVRLPEDLEGIDGIILPGGESTTMSKLMRRFGLFDDLKQRIEADLPAWGTCAGAILLAKEVTGLNPPQTLQVMAIAADRNAYGRQRDSFTSTVTFTDETGVLHSIDGVFIRAPKLHVLPDLNVTVFSTLNDEPVMLRQGNLLVTSFHPELTDDSSVHEYFMKMCH